MIKLVSGGYDTKRFQHEMTSFKIFQDYCLSVLEFFGAQGSTLSQLMKFFDLLQDLRSCHCCSLRKRNEDYDRESKINSLTPKPIWADYLNEV